MVVEKHLEKDRKLFAAFMDLEKAYNRVDRRGLCYIIRIYGMSGHMLEGIKSSYKDVSASM